MRILLFYDLPMESNFDKRSYIKFKKYIESLGFIPLQNSVFTKLCLNDTIVNFTINKLKKNKPPEGNIILLSVTETQFNNMIYLFSSNKDSKIIDDQKEVIEL